MNHTELIPTIFPNGLPDEFVSIKQELDSLSGDALDTSLKHWEALLLSDTTDTSIYFTMVNISTTAIWKKFILFLDVVLTILKIHFYKNMYQEK